ncbi:MAG: homocysteine S-methyltransferase family protein, partial [Oscillospiraceae bacterium]|nr:homocysteine S-methyltransferase family protein [Oscillospiraceae bacterium]
MKFRDFLKSNTVILDGAMGTMLQKSGLRLGEMPESFNITNPDVIVDIHRQYLNAGSNVIYCNTFGANRRKLSHCGYSVKEVISSAVTNAKKAIEGFDNAYVALDIGPIGELLEPIGTLKFDEAYDIFKEQMVIGEKCGADLIVIETMTDLSEARIALLAARENTSLPVFCSMSFEDNMRTFTGSDVISMAKVLEGLGADAIGINCSLGPAQIYPIAKKLCENSNIPVFVKANAGLPSPDGLSYDTTPLDFAKSSALFKELGINILGGCCGTTPEYIKNLKPEAAKIPLGSCQKSDINYICSASSPVSLDKVRIIGERINPTGKKLFKEALIKGDMDYILKQAIEQVDAGADILDINVGLPEIDEVAMMTKVVKAVSSVVNVPLQIDSSNPKAIEAGLRAFCGKAIVNSVNGEQKVLDNILPIVKKYGASVVGLTLDENGIPPKSEDRVKIAKRILDVATSYGIDKKDVFIDCLTLTVSAEQENASQTLSAVSMVRNEL